MAQIMPISGVDDRVSLAEALPLPSPFTLNVFPTNACNFKCAYCAHSLGAQGLSKVYGLDKGFMGMDAMAAIARQSKAFAPYKLLSFMGHGEPLLNPSLPQMIKLAAEAKIAKRIEVITNASMLTHALADDLIRSGLTNLRVSLQGLDSGAYKDTCGVEIDFGRFVKRLAYFHSRKKAHMGLFVKIMDVSLRRGEEDRFYQMFEGICDRMYIERIQPVYHAIDIAKDAAGQTKYDRYGNLHPQRTVCPLTFFSLSIWPNGDVQPCDAIYKPCLLGNIHEKALHEMWKSDKLNTFRLEHLKRKKNTLHGCKDCCAPDDVSHPKDALDGFEDILIRKFAPSKRK